MTQSAVSRTAASNSGSSPNAARRRTRPARNRCRTTSSRSAESATAGRSHNGKTRRLHGRRCPRALFQSGSSLPCPAHRRRDCPPLPKKSRKKPSGAAAFYRTRHRKLRRRAEAALGGIEARRKLIPGLVEQFRVREAFLSDAGRLQPRQRLGQPRALLSRPQSAASGMPRRRAREGPQNPAD